MHKNDNPKIIIGIIGGHLNNTNPLALELAQKTGRKLAEMNFTVASGGEDGIMELVAMGAKEVNGNTIAITKGNKKEDANKYMDYVIPTSLDLAFMNVLVWSSDGIIAFDGRFGTMCEIGLALDVGKPIVLLGNHSLINTEEIDSPNCLILKEYSEKNIEKAISFLSEKINNK